VHDRLQRLRREKFVEATGADPLSVRALQEPVKVLQRELGHLEGLLEAGQRNRSSLEADRTLLVKRLDGERAQVEQLQAELDEERNKGLWRRLFEGR
jgi:hypothetical protein